jgi:hypothetical protein
VVNRSPLTRAVDIAKTDCALTHNLPRRPAIDYVATARSQQRLIHAT